MRDQVRVWYGRDREQQHLTDAVDDDTARRWEGATLCGVVGELVWVPRERVDAGASCPRCLEIAGTAPPLSGQSFGAP